MTRCVGFACIAEATAVPVIYGRDLPLATLQTLARSVYHRATALDPWPETTPASDLGTSIDAGGLVMVELGLADEFRWARDVDELIDVLARGSRGGVTFGPVIAGVDWRDGMYDTAPDGFVTADGRIVGGHAILIRGVALKPRMRGRRISEPLFTWRNSWGPDYGVGGDGYITASDLEAILGDRPELMVPVARGYGGTR